MGGGLDSGDTSPSQFNERKTVTASNQLSSDTETTESTSNTETSTQQENTGTDSTGSETGTQETLNGSENGALEHIRDGGSESSDYNTFTVAARIDRGYSQELAAEVRSKSNEELQNELEEIRESPGGNKETEQFVAGVLASRSDSDFSTADEFTVVNFEQDETGEELIFEKIDEVFENVDEYVAGQIASEIEEVQIKELDGASGRSGDGKLIFDPTAEDLDGSISRDEHSETSIENAGEELAKYQDAAQGINVVAHELGHMFHKSLNLERTNSQPITNDGELLDSIHPDELTLEPQTIESVAQGDVMPEFDPPRREELIDRFKQHGENMVETLNAKLNGDSLSTVDSIVEPVRDYQARSFAELFADGFESYMDDIVSATNKQREMVETFDEFITGDSWTETTVDALQDHGVPLDPTQKASKHIAESVTEERAETRDVVNDTGRDEYGQAALFEFNEELFDGRDYMAGYVDEVTENEVTVSYLGEKISIDRENIESVKERKSLQ